MSLLQPKAGQALSCYISSVWAYFELQSKAAAAGVGIWAVLALVGEGCEEAAGPGGGEHGLLVLEVGEGVVAAVQRKEGSHAYDGHLAGKRRGWPQTRAATDPPKKTKAMRAMDGGFQVSNRASFRESALWIRLVRRSHRFCKEDVGRGRCLVIREHEPPHTREV